jgi:hypothetical protein
MRKKRVAHFATIKVCGSAVADCLQKCRRADPYGESFRRLHAAVLDHGLSAGDTSEVCETLTGCSIPFVVYSGYSKLDGRAAKESWLASLPDVQERQPAALEALRAPAPTWGNQLSPNIETRFYFNANDIMQRIPGSVTRSVALPDVPCVQAD